MSLGIVLQAFSPLGRGELLGDARVAAVARKHNVSSAAVALRWVTQRNAALVTQSASPEHIVQDAAIFDFTLSDVELASLDAVTSPVMCGNWSSVREALAGASDSRRARQDALLVV